MAELTYRFIVYPAGNSTTSTAAAAFVITQPYLADDYQPAIGGQNIDVLKGTTESRPWQIAVLDKDNFLASKLSGKLQGRLVRAQLKKDAGSFTTLATARITNISMGPSEGTITLQDERWLERQTDIWTDCDRDDDWPSTGANKKAGTVLVPPMLDGYYAQFVSPTVNPRRDIGRSTGNLVQITCNHLVVPSGNVLLPLVNLEVVSAQTIDFIRDDLKDDATTDWTTSASTGNFKTLRCRVNGTEYPVHCVNPRGGIAGPVVDMQDQLEQLEAWERKDISGDRFFLYVISTGLTPGAELTEAFLVAPQHEPTRHVPLHIGGQVGINGATLARKLYDENGIRYSTATFDSLEAVPEYGGLRYRITGKQKLGDWLDGNVYRPLGLVPFVNTNGQVAPVSIHMPQNVQSTTLFAFTSTNASEPHPDWQQQGRDVLSRITLTYTSETQLKTAELLKGAAADGLEVEEHTVSFNSTEFGGSTGRGIYEMKLDFMGFHNEDYTFVDGFKMPGARSIGKILASELFDRYQYGPIRGTITALSTAESIDPGDFATITLPTFTTPNSTSGRGGVRVVQMFPPVHTPAGPEFEWVDAGPNDQPLTAPTLALVKSTFDPQNYIKATVGGLSTAAQGWQMQMAVSSTQPSTSDSHWHWDLAGQSTGAVTVGPRPSGSKIWGRIRARAGERIRSAWSSPTASTLEAITAPPSLQITNSSGGVATYDWTLGSTKHRTQVMLDEASTSCTSTLEVVATVPIAATQYTVEGLTAGSSNCAGVRHEDNYGGFSAITSLGFSVSTSSPTAPGIARIAVYVGKSCSTAASAAPVAPSGFTLVGVSNT